MPSGVYERTPEMNAANSKAQKNSKAVKAHNDAMRDVPRPTEVGAAISDGMKNSNAVKSYAEARRGVPHAPERCAAMSEGLKNSDAVKANGDKMRGGNDLVTHHYIYDHDDLSLNTVQMTRSDHQKLHRLLQKLGYIIPYINVIGELND